MERSARTYSSQLYRLVACLAIAQCFSLEPASALQCPRSFAELGNLIRTGRLSKPIFTWRKVDEPERLQMYLEEIQNAARGSLSHKMWKGVEINIEQQTAAMPTVDQLNEIAGFTKRRARAKFVSRPGEIATDDEYHRALARGEFIIGENTMHDLITHAPGLRKLTELPEWMQIRAAMTDSFARIDSGKLTAEQIKELRNRNESAALAIELTSAALTSADSTGAGVSSYYWEGYQRRFQYILRKYADLTKQLDDTAK